MNIGELKNKAKATFRVSMTGRTTCPRESEDFSFAKELARVVVEIWWGVIHGGTMDNNGAGIMQAFAEGAYEAIVENALPLERNIGNTTQVFTDKWWAGHRTTNTTFIEPEAKSIDEMTERMTDECDIQLVFSRAGSGTLYETATQLFKLDLATYYEVREKTVPIVFVGTVWQNFLHRCDNNLDLSRAFSDNLDIHVITSVEEWKQLLIRLFHQNMT